VLVTAASLSAARISYHHGFIPAAVTSAPLVFRRRFPLAAFGLIVAAALADRMLATDVTFLVIIIAGYSAAVHSRYRAAALLTLAPAGVIIAAIFWKTEPADSPLAAGRLNGALRMRPVAPGLAGLQNAANGPLRVAGLLVLVSLISIAIVGAVMYASDRIRRAQAEHEASTRRALRLERARIASELHDVVTHNVSVMIVQAGAARQVLSESPDQARQALLAVEASGRAAMTELRHLLGLLSPPAGPAGSTGAADAAEGGQPAEDLQPQPGLGQLKPLVDRVTAAGLPVKLQVSGGLHDLPPGLDLAAFRVVQEALTNVIKHAGKAQTSVRLDLGDTDLLLVVTDAGRPVLAGRPVPASPAVPAGTGRGLLGLRERIALYGGELDAGPRIGGGWQVRARFPVEPLSAGQKLSAAGRPG
jgi:signal transduction histidine kinase